MMRLYCTTCRKLVDTVAHCARVAVRASGACMLCATILYTPVDVHAI